jgi:GNAT superfamily N-acetyltransferase
LRLYRPDQADELKLDKLYVHQDFHGRGVGHRALRGSRRDRSADDAYPQRQGKRASIAPTNAAVSRAQAVVVYRRRIREDGVMAKRLA